MGEIVTATVQVEKFDLTDEGKLLAEAPKLRDAGYRCVSMLAPDQTTQIEVFFGDAMVAHAQVGQVIARLSGVLEVMSPDDFNSRYGGH